MLDRNLAALGRGSPETCARVRRAAARGDAGFIDTADQVPAVEIGRGGTNVVALCSRKRPLEEARRLMEPIDIAGAAVFVVMGFGAGYHVAELARRVGKSGLILVFEPDVALLRAVLERIDHASWLSDSNIAILTEPDDGGAMSGALQGLEGLLALGMNADAITGRDASARTAELADLGVVEIRHAPSQARLGEAAKQFCGTLMRVAESARMTVATSLVQVDTTMRNLFMNIDRYALGPGAASLAGAFEGRPAVVVSAGPSLERNIHLLAQPGVRDRVVIIAVQTALKTLLARGIRPHFVTALDHSDLGTRFYEGLTAADVAGVTLVIEPKVNAAIPDAFPGRIVSVDDRYLDMLLGDALTEHRCCGANTGAVPSGATVAHLAYYLSRFLGCEPVALIGQDLGFTDGQYYASGAAIHDTWAGELNEFNTLEMLEWQRIKRMGTHLRPAAEHDGRPVYTDEQMNTYRVQFERDFKADADRRLRVFDCTEGGVAKGHTQACSLREFLATHAAKQVGCGMSDVGCGTPAVEGESEMRGVAPSRSQVRDRLMAVRKDIWRIGEASRQAAVVLSEMTEHHRDQSRVNKLIQRVYELRDEVQLLEPGFSLVQVYNQRGGLDRVKADRAINLDLSLPPMERQRRQIDRDCGNVRKLAESADALGAMLDDAMRVLDGAPKRTRRGGTPGENERSHGRGMGAASGSRTRVRTGALVWLGRESMNWAGRELLGGTSVLGATLLRLARSNELVSITVLCEDVAAARAAARFGGASAPAVDYALAGAGDGMPEFVRRGRLFAGSCWRGGIGGATVFDEALAPGAMAVAMERQNMDAALVIGAGWSMVDPALCDEMIRRHAENPESHRFTFSQAAPGLGGCVLSRKLMSELSRLREQAGVLGTLGAMMSYLPPAPIADPIAFPACVMVDPSVRDAGRRFIIDSEPALTAAWGIMRSLDGAGTTADAREVACAARACDSAASSGPGEITVLLDASASPSAGHSGTTDWRTRLIQQAAGLRDDVGFTFAGAIRRPHGQPREEVLLNSSLPALVRAAREAGCRGVHVRTGLRAGAGAIDQLLSANPDIVSVDLLAESPGVYGAVAGEDAMSLAWAGVEHIMRRRGQWPAGDSAPGAWRGWLVPRMTKCDAAYPEMERFYDRWIMLCGWAVIDPLAAAMEGQRIAPLRTPRSKAVRDARTTMTVQPSGAVLGPDGAVVGDVSREPVAEVWQRLWAARSAAGLV